MGRMKDRLEFDMYGIARIMPDPGELAGMGSPVRCFFCGKVYDLQAVHVTQRYADCSVWKTPCCNHEADDRRWPGRAHYEDLN